MQNPVSLPLDAWEIELPFLAKTQFARKNLFGEVTLTDEEGHEKHAPGAQATADGPNVGFELPKTFQDLGK
jgi:hypothetical protein